MMNDTADQARQILKEARTIAVLGMKGEADAREPAHQVPRYLEQQGYTIIPINPELEEQGYPGAVATLGDLSDAPDVVEVFRRSEAIDEHVEEILALRPKAVWFQLGIRNDAAAERLRAAGIDVVQDRCMFKDHMAM
jgi:predicted CoA-binding protein